MRVTGRLFEKMNPPGGPDADRFDVSAGTLVKSIFQILVTGEEAIPLDQPKTQQRIRRKLGMAQRLASIQRNPDHISLGLIDQQSVRFMHLLSVVQRFGLGHLAEPAHAGQWGQSKQWNRLAQGNFRLHLHDGRSTGRKPESIGTTGGGTI